MSERCTELSRCRPGAKGGVNQVFKDQRDMRPTQIDHASNFTEGKHLIPEFNFCLLAACGGALQAVQSPVFAKKRVGPPAVRFSLLINKSGRVCQGTDSSVPQEDHEFMALATEVQSRVRICRWRRNTGTTREPGKARVLPDCFLDT